MEAKTDDRPAIVRQNDDGEFSDSLRRRSMLSSSVPFFSFVIPCCDVAPYVRECLDSVLRQQFANWECVIGVEASKDDTEAIVRGYAAKDTRIRVITGPRTGSCSASRNAGTDAARGEYVIFLDGDDTIAEGSLRRIADRIAERPGADMYPCAIRVVEDGSGRETELRDNYPDDAPAEMTGVEATLLTLRDPTRPPCPMLQMTVFRRKFLVERGLKCIVGLRRQDSEFSPRALYLAKRVVPIHEPFYLYRIRPNAIGTSARGQGYFHGDWATILRSLLAFHAKVSREPGFDRRVAERWARAWTQWIFYFWFDPDNVRSIPRARRAETLGMLFANGFEDYRLLLANAPRAKRTAGRWVEMFVRHPALCGTAERLFRLYFSAARARDEWRCER
ncbi:MAG: glycosyltransferase [Kiritimatiellae bacterium]|nr:glycosyltransferase [Kiritimatiellia bacterium]